MDNVLAKKLKEQRDQAARDAFAELRAMPVDELRQLLDQIPDDDQEVLALMPLVSGILGEAEQSEPMLRNTYATQAELSFAESINRYLEFNSEAIRSLQQIAEWRTQAVASSITAIATYAKWAEQAQAQVVEAFGGIVCAASTAKALSDTILQTVSVYEHTFSKLRERVAESMSHLAPYTAAQPTRKTPTQIVRLQPSANVIELHAIPSPAAPSVGVGIDAKYRDMLAMAS